jgi:hypothetical protein
LIDVQSALSAIDGEAINDLKLIGFFVRDVRGSTVEGSRFTWGGVDGVEIPNVGMVYAAGTGRGGLLNLLSERGWTPSAAGNEYQVAHSLLGALTNEDYMTANTIPSKWGGGFEAVVFSAETGRFEKVGDILHTFWKLTDQTDVSIDFLPMFYKTTYWRDLLIIRSARFDKIGERKFKLQMTDTDFVFPVLKDARDYNLSEVGSVDFSHKVICCHVSIEGPDGHHTMIFLERIDQEPLVTLEMKDDLFGRLHIDGKMSKIILEEVRSWRERAEFPNEIR